MNRLWVSIKRNPVINAFLAAVLLQVLQDWQANNIDWPHIFGYLATVCIAVAARMFVVPVEKHEDLKELVSKTIVNLEAEFQQRLSERLDHLDGGGKRD